MKSIEHKILQRYQYRLQLYRQGWNINYNESPEEKQARINRAKHDFAFFVRHYLSHYTIDPETHQHIPSPDFHIKTANLIKRHKNIKIFLRWGRGLGKSVLADLIIPLWLWINDQISYMVLIGNNQDKAQILLSDLQWEFENNELIKYDFGEQIKFGSWEKGYFITQNGFVAKALGMGQDTRGLRYKSRRPDYIVADDLEDKDTLKNPRIQDQLADWLLTAVIPTMDGATRRFIFAGNRFAPRMIQTVLEEKTKGWTLSQVNAYDPTTYEPAWKEKYSPDYFRKVEQEIGRIAAMAEFNNRPHTEGKIFTQEQIIFLDNYPRLNQFKAIVGHWDVAYSGKNDYNAVRVWGLYDNAFYYIDGFVRQAKMEDAVRWMASFQCSLSPTVSVRWQFEAQFWNDAVWDVITYIENEMQLRLNIVKTDPPRRKKFDRILRLQAYYQNKKIFYPAKKQNDPDLLEGLEQLFGIEPGYRTHDDAPDADEQAIAWLEHFLDRNHTPIITGSYKRNLKRRII